MDTKAIERYGSSSGAGQDCRGPFTWQRELGQVVRQIDRSLKSLKAKDGLGSNGSACGSGGSCGQESEKVVDTEAKKDKEE